MYPTVILAVISLLVVVVAAMVVTRAQLSDSGSLQERVLSIASQLRAPGDENTITVASSSLSTAQHMRYEIQQDLLAGMKEIQIFSAMKQEYGPSVMAAPSIWGFGSVVWILPGVVLVGLLVGAFVYLRRAARALNPQRTSTRTSTEDVSDDNPPDTVALERMRDYL